MLKTQKKVLDKINDMKIKITLYLLLGIINLNCQEKKETYSTVENINKMNDNIIETVLIKHLKQGTTYTIDEAGAGLPKRPFEIQELEATAETVNNILKSNGFKELNSENFNQKIKNIFGRIIDPNSQSTFLYVNYFDKCNREMVMYKNNEIDYAGTFIDKQRKIITDFYYIPEIIDYQKEYPKVNNIENIKIIRKSSINDLDIEIPYWKDVPNLKEIRKKNIQTLTARNMYLFNDSKAQYKWLILNDQYFMEKLVKTFGYTEDSELLKWVIEKTKFDKNNPSDYGKLFWTKECDGNVRLHANTFKLLQKLYIPNDPSENRFILDHIKDYLEYLGNRETSQNENLTAVERTKIMSNLAYFVEQYKYDPKFDEDNKMMGRLRFFLDDQDVEILKKNNYFGLPKFKEWWDNADYDEYFIDGEYNGEWGSVNQPLNSVEWRKQHPKK